MDALKRILVVDDEEALCESLRTYLELEGYAADSALSAEEALRLDLTSYDLFILDIMMGGMNGMELAAYLKGRADTSDVPIIFLTARDGEDDMVAGLHLGADDYISKPYSVRNVLARVEAVLRRAAPVKSKGLRCDRASLTCTVDGVIVKLPRKEFELLSLLLEHPGRIFTREELLDRIWEDRVVTDRSVDVHVAKIRSKIAPYGAHLVSRSGYGYGWQA